MGASKWNVVKSPLGVHSARFSRLFLDFSLFSYFASCGDCSRLRCSSHQNSYFVSSVSACADHEFLGRLGFCRHLLFGRYRCGAFQLWRRHEGFSHYPRLRAGSRIRPSCEMSRLLRLIRCMSYRLVWLDWVRLPGGRSDLYASPQIRLGYFVFFSGPI